MTQSSGAQDPTAFSSKRWNKAWSWQVAVPVDSIQFVPVGISGYQWVVIAAHDTLESEDSSAFAVQFSAQKFTHKEYVFCGFPLQFLMVLSARWFHPSLSWINDRGVSEHKFQMGAI